MVKAIESGDRSALDEAAAADVQLGGLLKKGTDIYTDEKPVMMITKRLELIDKHKRFIAGDLEQFHKVLQELEALTDASDKALQKAKIAVLLAIFFLPPRRYVELSRITSVVKVAQCLGRSRSLSRRDAAPTRVLTWNQK